LELGRHLRHVGLECAQALGNRLQEWANSTTPTSLLSRFPTGSTIARGIGLGGHPRYRIDGTAEICPEHQASAAGGVMNVE